MPSKSGVRVVGAARLGRALRAAGVAMADRKELNSKVARTVAAAAARLAPRRSGRLAANVRASRGAGRAVVSVGGTRVPYAWVIYYGWPARNIAGTPFIEQAVTETEPVWLPEYTRDIQHLLDRVEGA